MSKQYYDDMMINEYLYDEIDSHIDMNDCSNHYYEYLCTDKCKQEGKNEVTISSEEIANYIMDDIMETVNEVITYRETHKGDYYTRNYGMIPEKVYRKDGTVSGILYKTNSVETKKIWGDCLFINYSEDENDENDEHDHGDVADYHREKELYRY